MEGCEYTLLTCIRGSATINGSIQPPQLQRQDAHIQNVIDYYNVSRERIANALWRSDKVESALR